MSKIKNIQQRRCRQRREEQSEKGVVETEESDWSGLWHEISNENEAPDISNSGSIDIALQLRNMVSASRAYTLVAKKMATTKKMMVRRAMGVSLLEHGEN